MGKLLVQDLMTPEPETLGPSSSVADLLDLIHDRNIRHVPVVDDDGELVGIVSHRDVLRNALATSQVDLPLTLRDEVLQTRTVDTVMTDDVITVEANDPLAEAAALMLENKIGCVPVLEGSRLVGILTESDFVRHVSATP